MTKPVDHKKLAAKPRGNVRRIIAATMAASDPPELSAKRMRAALAQVAVLAARRASIPVLATVRVTIAQDALSLTTTDLDMMATTADLCAPHAEPLDVCVYRRDLEAFLKGLDGPLFLTVLSSGALGLACDGARASLPTLPVTDFPVMTLAPKPDAAPPSKSVAKRLAGRSPPQAKMGRVHMVRIAAADWSHALATVSPSISRDECRYYLNGVYLDHTDGVMKLVATDGRRLACLELRTARCKSKFGVIIPRAAAAWMQAQIKSGDVLIQLTASKIQVDCGGLTLISKLIDGTYPDYSRVIPSGVGALLSIRPAPTQAGAVEWVGRQSAGKTQAVQFDCNGKAVAMSAKSFDGATASRDLDCEFDGPPMRFGMNAAYLVTALKAGAEPTMGVADESSPVLFHYADPALTSVVMPLRV